MRNTRLDIARAIGIFLVVWGHIVSLCPIKSEIYLFHMPLFFIISGYLFKNDEKNFTTVLKKKIQAYMLPYTIYMVICLTLFILLYCLTGQRDKIFISPSILIAPYGVVTALWFFWSIFEVYMMYYLISRFITKESVKNLCMLLCFSIGYLLYVTDVKLPFYIGSSLSMILFFHIGYLLKKHSFLESSHSKQWSVFIASAICFATGIYFHLQIDIKVNMLGEHPLLFILSAFGGSYIVLFVSIYLNKITALKTPLVYLGQNTLGVFALHIVCIDIFKLIPGNITSTLYGLPLAILCIVGSLIMDIPIRKYLISRLKLFNI